MSRAGATAARSTGGDWWQCDAVDAAAVRRPDGPRSSRTWCFISAALVTAARTSPLVVPTFHSSGDHHGQRPRPRRRSWAVAGSCCRRRSRSRPAARRHARTDLAVRAAKLAAGAYARMFGQLYGTPVVTLRPYMAYGPGQHPSKVVPYTILSLLRGERRSCRAATAGSTGCTSTTSIEALRAAACAPRHRGTDTRSRLRDGSADPEHGRAARAHGRPRAHAHVWSPADGGEGPVRIADLGATVTALGWRPTTPLEDGLAATVEWYRQDTL